MPAATSCDPAMLRRLFLGLLPLLSALCAGCAKTGEPLPPVIRVPRPARDLAGMQLGGGVVLRVSLPDLNTDGSPAENSGFVEVLRAAEERGRDPAPLPEDVFLGRAVAIIRLPAGDAARIREDSTLVFHDDLADEPAEQIFERAYRYAVRFINRKNQTAGLSNQVYLAPVRLPPPPAGLRYTLAPDCIRLAWDPPRMGASGRAPAAGYRVYRSENPKDVGRSPLSGDLVTATEFEDRSFQFDRTYYYAVSLVASVRDPYAETLPSPALKVVAEDTFAPGPPQNLDGVVEKGVVVLLWTASPDGDVAGYRVYRREVRSETKELLAAGLIRVLSFRDASTRPGAAYEYSVCAVDGHGNEGPAASIVLEVP